MKVYSFTGKSGTGKSYQAIRVAKEKGIPALIDDGLLIYKNKNELDTMEVSSSFFLF